MLKGSREAILRKIQPVSIHGQISWDLHFSDAQDPDGPIQMARIGPEALERGIEPGDRITLTYAVGAVTRVTKSQAR